VAWVFTEARQRGLGQEWDPGADEVQQALSPSAPVEP
jgi:hypothetical protein